MKQIITGDEKWIVYNNVERKRSWFNREETDQLTVKVSAFHQKKVMLTELEGNYIFELLQNNQTSNTNLYCRQLYELDAAIKQKRSELVNRKGVVLGHSKSPGPDNEMASLI